MHLVTRVHWETNRRQQHADQSTENRAGRRTEMHLHIKVRDGFAAGLNDAQGEEVGSYEGTCRTSFPATTTAIT